MIIMDVNQKKHVIDIRAALFCDRVVTFYKIWR